MITGLPSPCHVASALCDAEAERALGHLTGVAGMRAWCLGMTECVEHEPGLLRGRSLFDGSIGWVRVEIDASRFSVDYWCGSSPALLSPRIHARAVPGPALGYGAGQCLATLLAWRPADMDDDRWRRLMLTHETEILLIRDQLARRA